MVIWKLWYWRFWPPVIYPVRFLMDVWTLVSKNFQAGRVGFAKEQSPSPIFPVSNWQDSVLFQFFFAGHFFFRGEHILVWEGWKLLEGLGGNYLSLPPDTPTALVYVVVGTFFSCLNFRSRNLGKMISIFDIVLLKNGTQHAPKRKGVFPKMAQCSNIQVGEESSIIHLQNIHQKYLGRWNLYQKSWFLAKVWDRFGDL